MPHPPVFRAPKLAEHTVAQRSVLIFASGFGAGYSPLASGTVATLFAIPLYFLLFHPLNGPQPWQAPAYLALLLLFFAAGVSASTYAESVLDSKDPHYVTIDEFVGFFVSMFLVPVSVASVTAAFFLFRLFDVWKPNPIRRSQLMPNGVGIMIDDVLAGVYTCIILNMVFRFFIN